MRRHDPTKTRQKAILKFKLTFQHADTNKKNSNWKHELDQQRHFQAKNVNFKTFSSTTEHCLKATVP